MSGWVKLHRKLIGWKWISSPRHVSVFVNLLIRCNYKPSTWRGIELQPGEMVTGRKQIMSWTGLSEKQVRACLDDFEKGQIIGRKRATNCSIISITNWETYQDEGQREGRKKATSKNIRIKKKEEEAIGDDEIQVLNALNETLNSKYQPTDKNISLIRRRLKEGYGLEQFREVFQYKRKDWEGTPIEKNLTPSTLLGNKFDEYVAQAQNANKKKFDPLERLIIETLAGGDK